MSDFETIDVVELNDVTGGVGNPLKLIGPAVRGVGRAYEAVKPYAKKAWDAVNVVGTAAGAAEAIHQGYNWLTGRGEQPQQPQQPAQPPQGGH